MTETTAQPLTRDDVRAIVDEEISKPGDLLRAGGLGLEYEGPILDVSDDDPVVATGHLNEIVHELAKVVVDLKLVHTAVIAELQRHRRVQPASGRDGISVVVRSDARQKESFAFAKSSHGSQLNGSHDVIPSEMQSSVTANDHGHKPSPSVDDAGAHSVGDGPGAGDASATPAAEVTDPHISARYDAPLNAIAMSVGGTDDLYFDRDATFLLIDELRAALHDQAKNGGLA
nr:hypothetical protein [Rhodococcus qingshengii]THJ70694.1 hypothetical protein EU244_15255 [Rhodococcus qingshengii]